MTDEEKVKNLLTELVDMIDNGSQRDLDRADEISESILEAIEKQKTGHWIRFKEFENGYYHIRCSECGQYWSVDGHAKVFKHCFNCGAKMIGE